jgi:hypothetical protein
MSVGEWIKKEGIEKALTKLATDFYDSDAGGLKPWDAPVEVITRPTEGIVLHGGWGGDQDPDNWKVVPMKDKPEKFKVVDDKGTNIATDFSTKAIAQQYIDWFKINENPDEQDPEPPQPGTGGGGGEPEKPAEGYTVVGPYPAVGKELGTIKRRAVRHYQSNAPDDETVELNAKGIKYRKHQLVTYVTMNKIEHDDTMSQKIGGTHMGTGWFVNSIEFESGLCGIGVEKKHPTTSHNDVKGTKIGSILNKKIGMASVYFADENKVELWTDTGDGKWKKQVEGTNVKGFNPKATTFECQLRIDGFVKGSDPTLHLGVVQEIA